MGQAVLSFDELNTATAEKFVELKEQVVRKYGKSRREFYDRWDQSKAKALLPTDYDLATW